MKPPSLSLKPKARLLGAKSTACAESWRLARKTWPSAKCAWPKSTPSARPRWRTRSAAALRDAIESMEHPGVGQADVGALVRDACGARIAARDRAVEDARARPALARRPRPASAVSSSTPVRVLLGAAVVAVASAAALGATGSIRFGHDPVRPAPAAPSDRSAEPARNDAPAHVSVSPPITSAPV